MLAPKRAGGVNLDVVTWLQSEPFHTQVSLRTLCWLNTPAGPRFRPPNITTLGLLLPNCAMAGEILFGGTCVGNLRVQSAWPNTTPLSKTVAATPAMPNTSLRSCEKNAGATARFNGRGSEAR